MNCTDLGPGDHECEPSGPRERTTLLELMGVFLRLGLVAFGGPVAHIALMEQATVKRQRWVSRRHFLDLLAVTNLVPGPNSTQMIMHVGYVQRGDLGTWVAGLAFILPAFAITLIISWFYQAYGALPATEAVFYGIKPAVVAMIAHALWRLAPDTVTGVRTGLIFAGALVLNLLGASELLVMGLGAAVGLLVFGHPWKDRMMRGLMAFPWVFGAPAAGEAAGGGSTGALWQVGLLFLKFGGTLYGSGYLLIAFIKTDLVDRLGWLTVQELLDAVAIGQMTPGPVLTTSTAAGYIIAGVPGAVIATAGIFLPSFFFVMLAGRWMPVLRESAVVRAVLKGVTPAVVAVMLTVTLTLAGEAFIDVFSLILGLCAVIALIRWKIDAVLLIGAASTLGYLWMMII